LSPIEPVWSRAILSRVSGMACIGAQTESKSTLGVEPMRAAGRLMGAAYAAFRLRMPCDFALLG
jgi:hypothetical protein